LATFTLRQLLDSPTPITVGDLKLSAFRRDSATNVVATSVFIDTIEGDEPGLVIRTNGPLSSNAAARTIGFEFRAAADGAIIEGASLSLNGATFSANDAGGSVEASIRQGGPNDNIAIDVFNDNSAGAADDEEAADAIDGGPVTRFRFDYDFSLIPANGVTASVDSATLLFDLAGDDGGGGGTLPSGFDGLQYIASYADLIAAFGANAAAGEAHYLSNGQSEGRSADDFDEDQYLENYGDLRSAFGNNGDAATQHYIDFGFEEGRSDVDGLQYIASHDDLIPALGANEAAGVAHYVQFGRDEGREKDTFNETQYLANYPDLAAAFGNDGDAATVHYIQFGSAEGRVDEVLV
jgi:hypothetical protein